MTKAFHPSGTRHWEILQRKLLEFTFHIDKRLCEGVKSYLAHNF